MRPPTPEPPPQLEFPLEEIAPLTRPRRQPEHRGYVVNPRKVRQYALAMAKRERHHEFTAVTVEFIQRIDARLRNVILDEIKRHPSMGKRLG